MILNARILVCRGCSWNGGGGIEEVLDFFEPPIASGIARVPPDLC